MKEKIIVSNIEEENTPDGIRVLRITLRKGKETFIKGARYVDYIDEKKRKSIFRTWKRDIEKVEAEQAINKDEIEAKIKVLKGEELKDE